MRFHHGNKEDHHEQHHDIDPIDKGHHEQHLNQNHKVDPETGLKDVGGEPMKTLRTYRTSFCPEEREVTMMIMLAKMMVMIVDDDDDVKNDDDTDNYDDVDCQQ